MLTEKPWNERPPRQSVSDLENIGQISISSRNNIIMQTIFNLSSKYPNYRKIRGDGNCFYRAVFFSFLRRSRLDNFNDLFPAHHHIDLTICRRETIPEPFRKFYKNEFILKSWKEGWQEIFSPEVVKNLTPQQLEQLLIQKLNCYWWLDFLLVNYYRCLTYNTIKNNKNFYRQFLPGVSTELFKISKYGEESEGVEIQALGYSIESHISIHIVNRQGAFPIFYECKGAKITQSLLFRPGHYDVLIQTDEKPKRTTKVKFKTDIATTTKSPKSEQSTRQEVKPRMPPKIQLQPPRAILKKSDSGTWKAVDARIVRVDNTNAIDRINLRLVMLIILVVLSVVLGLLSVYKAKIKVRNVGKTRTDWSWRARYLAQLQMNRLQ